MSDDEKEPEDKPKDEPEKQPQETGEAGGPGEAGEPGEVPMNRAERRARKHKRKGELRSLHDRDRQARKGLKGHGDRVFRRKSI